MDLQAKLSTTQHEASGAILEHIHDRSFTSKPYNEQTYPSPIRHDFGKLAR